MTSISDKLGPKNGVPQVVEDAVPDLQQVKPADWSVLALVDGVRTLEAICQSATMSLEQAQESLARLARLGMITLPTKTRPSGDPRRRSPASGPTALSKSAASSSKPSKPSTPSKGSVGLALPTGWPISPGQFLFDPVDLELDLQLSVPKRKQILYYHYHLKRVTYYALFQVPREAKGRDIRRAYFALSKEFHPDLFFRKDIGPFKPRVEAIFKWISRAYATLSNRSKRKRYDALLDQGLLGEWQLRSPKTRSGPKSRPVRKPATTGAGAAAAAKASRATGAKASSAAGGRRSSLQAWMERAKQAEADGNLESALTYYMRILDERFVPVVALRAAQCLLKQRARLATAAHLAQKALDDESMDARQKIDGWFLLGRIFEANRQVDRAVRAYEEALALDPSNARVRAALERAAESA